MSMFEWIGESINPGPVGGVELGGDRPRLSPGKVLLQVALAAVVVAGFVWLAKEAHWKLTDPRVAGGLFAYIGFAWLVRPQADTSNLGWLGGLVDNPFRVSDDWNRLLLFLSIALLPGRIVGDAVEDTLRLVFGKPPRGWSPPEQGGWRAPVRMRRVR